MQNTKSWGFHITDIMGNFANEKELIQNAKQYDTEIQFLV